MMKSKSILHSTLALALASLMMLTVGCEDDDKQPPTGTATVRGEVTNVSSAYAPGVLAGITVHLVGDVTLKTLSNEQGIFEFTNVPAGDFVLIFYINGAESTKAITVAEGSTTVLAHVYINERGEVIVTAPAPEPEPVIAVAGTWSVTPLQAPASQGVTTVIHLLTLQQNGTVLSGTLTESSIYSAQKDYPPAETLTYTVGGTITGTAIELTLAVRSVPGRTAYWESMSGTVNAAGTAMSGSYAGEYDTQGTWSAEPAVQ